jgi:lantibiotic modifying enzyme
MRMGVDDLSRQQRRLDDGLAGFVGARLGSFPTPEAPGALRRTAELLGEELLARAQPQAEGSLRWRFPDHDRQPRRHRTPLGLYDGLSGVAVFLAGLAAATGDERWSSAAEGTLRTLEAELAERRSAPPDAAEAGPGPGLDGIGSLIYAGALVSRLTGSPRASGLVAAAAECFAADSTPESPGDDVAQGLAGLILFLLAAHEVGAPAGPLDAARRLGDELAGRAGTVPAALGLAHGGSGIGLALARLHGVTGETVHRTAAVRCFDVERAAVERWMREPGPPAARAVSRPWSISSWCNGPPGMALARALALEHLEEPAIRRDLDLALEAVLQPLERRSDHLCCGNLGVVEVLWTLGRRCQRPEALARADEILAGVLDRAKRRGHFVLSASPFEHRIFDPGFFRGLSGIGYLLLRMSELADLPSVLAFETRCPARSTPQPHPEEV